MTTLAALRDRFNALVDEKIDALGALDYEAAGRLSDQADGVYEDYQQARERAGLPRLWEPTGSPKRRRRR